MYYNCILKDIEVLESYYIGFFAINIIVDMGSGALYSDYKRISLSSLKVLRQSLFMKVGDLLTLKLREPFGGEFCSRDIIPDYVCEDFSFTITE